MVDPNAVVSPASAPAVTPEVGAPDSDWPPLTIELEGAELRRVQVLKNGRYIAVARYTGDSRDVVFKGYREQPTLLAPVARRLLGFMASREQRVLRRLEGIDGVPELLATHGPRGMIYGFVEGSPIPPTSGRVADGFFHRLEVILNEVHARGVAHADLSKRDNLLVGEDGHPHLIDFQIAWTWPPDRDAPWFARCIPGFVGRSVLRNLQRADMHHLDKRWSRMQPETLDEERLVASTRVRPWIWLHRTLAKPYRAIRRRVLGRR